MLRSAFRLVRDVYRYLRFPRSAFRGVFRTFAEAEAAAPRDKSLGYDSAAFARECQAGLNVQLDCTDYPLLYHLERVVRPGSTVLDVGGNIGVHYLRFRQRWPLESVSWIVWDLPEIVKAGRETCSGLPNVSFVTGPDELQGRRVDTLLAVDCLQYFPTLPFAALAARGIRPQHMLTDFVPLYEGEQFVTLQNGGPIYHPQHVFNRAEYLDGVRALGYELVDAWSISAFSLSIPFHRDRTIPAYTGCFFAKRGSHAA